MLRVKMQMRQKRIGLEYELETRTRNIQALVAYRGVNLQMKKKVEPSCDSMADFKFIQKMSGPISIKVELATDM